MALGTTNLKISDVKTALSETTYVLSELCTSDKINIWSEKKPYNLTGPGSGYDGGGGAGKTNGLYREVTPSDVTYYNVPTSNYRLGDFRGYNHSAGAPVQVNFTDVRLKGSGTAMSSPYTFIGGYEYQITMSVVEGEIPSLDICDKTHPYKVSGSTGGEYGGLFLWDAGSSPITPFSVELDSVDVFGIGSGKVVDFTCVQTTGHPFDIYFCEHYWEAEPPAHDLYMTGGWTIEDTAQYRDIFSATTLNVGITSTNVVGISTPSVSVMCSGKLTNGTGSDVVIDVKISVSINGNTTRNYTQTSYTLVSAGATWSYNLWTSYGGDFVDGSNTVVGTMYLMKGSTIYTTKAINKTFDLDLT